jgi:hypothetical protein
MNLRRPRALAFVVRLLVAVLLTTLLSGVPASSAYALGFEEAACDGDCPASDDTGHCPPNCTHGDCAKVHPAPLPDAIIPPLVTPAPELLPVPTPAPKLPSRWRPDDVFHPPRA